MDVRKPPTEMKKKYRYNKLLKMKGTLGLKYFNENAYKITVVINENKK